MKMQGLCEKELRVRSLYDMDNKKGFTMKTKEELNALKEEVETLNKKLTELSEDELKQVTGGYHVPIHIEVIRSKERDIALIGDYANGSGGGVINEGKF